MKEYSDGQIGQTNGKKKEWLRVGDKTILDVHLRQAGSVHEEPQKETRKWILKDRSS